jgi:TolB-like protein
VRSILGLEPKKQAPQPTSGLPPPEFGDEPVIVLMPFRLLGEGAADEDFIHGLADDIISHLGLVPGVVTLTHQDASEARSARELARQTGASHIIEGSVRQSGDDVRISVHLVDDRGARILSKRFDRTLEKPFALMDEVAEVTTEAVTEVLGAKPEPVPEPAPEPLMSDTGEEPDVWLEEEVSPKSRRLTLFLCLPPMGVLGLHRFYTGRPFLGILYFLTGGFFMVGVVLDLLVILSGFFKDGKKRRLKYWRPARKRDLVEDVD